MTGMFGPDSMGARRRIALVSFAVFFASYALLFQGVQWNEGSRIALTLSLLEDHTFQIDRYHQITEDKARYNGHWYSDKAPGLALVALPPAALAQFIQTGMSNPGGPRHRIRFITYLSTVGTSALAAALTSVAIYIVALHAGSSTAAATFAMWCFALATPVRGWATAFFAHVSAGMCLFLGFAMLLFALHDVSSQGNRTLGRRLLAGLLLGAAVLMDYPAAVASVLVFVWAAAALRGEGLRTMAVALAPVALGGLAMLALLLGQNWAVFGSPFSLAYDFTQFRGMHAGFFGLHAPSATTAFEILLGGRGLLWIAPILFLCPPALYFFHANLRSENRALTPGLRSLAWLVAAIVCYFVVMNSSYFLPGGGWSSGPRHLTPMLAFVCLPLCVLWDRFPRWRPVFATLFGVSLIISFLFALVWMEAPQRHANLFVWLASELSDGKLRGLYNAEAEFIRLAENLGAYFGIATPKNLYPYMLAGLFCVQVGGGASVLRLLFRDKASREATAAT